MKLSWYVRRLSRMSAPEIAMRGRDSVVKLMWRREWMRELNTTRPSPTVAPGAFRTALSPELASFIDAVKTGGPMPISLSSLLATTYATIAASRPSSEKQSQRVLANVRDLRSVAAPVAPLEPLDPEPFDTESV